jgi:hypothetical protein
VVARVLRVGVMSVEAEASKSIGHMADAAFPLHPHIQLGWLMVRKDEEAPASTRGSGASAPDWER